MFTTINVNSKSALRVLTLDGQRPRITRVDYLVSNCNMPFTRETRLQPGTTEYRNAEIFVRKALAV